MKDFKPKTFKDKQKSVTVFPDLCKGCGLCIEKCPQKAIRFSAKGLGIYSAPTVEVEIQMCNLCGICEVVCPESALRVEK